MAIGIEPLTLARVPSLNSLPRLVLEDIARVTEPLRFDAGTQIVQHLAKSREFYMILAGSVRVCLVASTGRALTYQILPTGEFFGEVAAVDGEPRTASVLAETEAVVGRIHQPEFQRLLSEHHNFSLVILHRLARLNRRLTERLFEYHAYDVRGRVYSEILRAVEDQAEHEYTITDKDMASRVGTTRENVTRINSDLRKRGIAKRGQDGTVVVQVQALKALLGECEFS